MNNEKDRTTSAEGLAEVLSLSSRRVTELVKAGVLVRVGRGQYPVVENVRRYIDYLREQIRGGDGLDPVQERARLHKAQRERVELENRVTTGELVETAKVGALWENIVLNCRAHFLAMPHNVTALIQATDGEFNSIKRVLDQSVRDSLNELSEKMGSDSWEPKTTED